MTDTILGLFYMFIPKSQSWYISKKNLFIRGIVTIRRAIKTALKLAKDENLFFVKSHISLNMESIKQTKIGNSLYNLVFSDMTFFFLNLPHFSLLFTFFLLGLSQTFLCQGIFVCQRSELQRAVAARQKAVGNQPSMLAILQSSWFITNPLT